MLYKVVDKEQKMMAPKTLRQKIIFEDHDVPIVVHVEINQTIDLIKQTYWWRRIWSYTVDYV